MKKLLLQLTLTLILCAGGLKAQFVPIPDPVFQGLLQLGYPSCFNSFGEMDTTCLDIISETNLQVSQVGVLDFDGIQYFDSLVYLDCSFNGSTSLHSLPPKLNYLDCAGNLLVALPPLPDSLKILNCYDNMLTSLPALPDSLVYLDCSYNIITRLVALPDGMLSLACSNNELLHLCDLPQTLRYLGCQSNQIVSLPALPDSLRSLECSFNSLFALPFLPASMEELKCDFNPPLACLPVLNPNLRLLQTMGTRIACLPNYTSFITSSNSSLLVCSTTAGICTSRPMVRGKVFDDLNGDQRRNPGERLLAGIPVLVSPGNWTGHSNDYCGYEVNIDTLPLVNLIKPGRVPYRIASPASYTVQTLRLGMDSISYDFGYRHAQTVNDIVIRLSTSPIYLGGQAKVVANVENIGTLPEVAASVAIELPLGVVVSSIWPPNGSILGNTVTWTGVNLELLEKKSFSTHFQVPSNWTAGNTQLFNASLAASQTDFTPSNNRDSLEVNISNVPFFEQKRVNKAFIPASYIADEEELRYTISFQNQGNDTLHSVVIRDTIDLTKIDFRTLRLSGSSHPVSISARQQGIVEFNFENINLPPASINPEASFGFVQFVAFPLAGLQTGTIIQNKADVMYDFGRPITTNSANTVIGLSGASAATQEDFRLDVYPNPTNGRLTITIHTKDDTKLEILVTDALGKVLVKQGKTLNNENPTIYLETSDWPNGIYYLTLTSEHQTVGKKISVIK